MSESSRWRVDTEKYLSSGTISPETGRLIDDIIDLTRRVEVIDSEIATSPVFRTVDDHFRPEYVGRILFRKSQLEDQQ